MIALLAKEKKNLYFLFTFLLLSVDIYSHSNMVKEAVKLLIKVVEDKESSCLTTRTIISIEDGKLRVSTNCNQRLCKKFS